MATRPASDQPSPAPDPGDAEACTSFGAWTLVWTIYLAKLITIVLIFWAAHSYQSAVLLAATTWVWLGPLVVVGASPAIFRYRLRRVRARKQRLQRAEWMLEPLPLKPRFARSPKQPNLPVG